MNGVRVSNDDVRKHLNKLKTGKQAGIDGIKPELYKWLGRSHVVIAVLSKCMNNLILTGTVPEHWKRSKTVLIPKKNKPNCAELRPISLNSISYKLFMSIMKEKIFDHMKENKCILELQSGFTQGKRIEDNLLILRYCTAESRRAGKPLFITAIDFAKAFDSVDRVCIINTLIKYKCDPLIIELIAQIYSGDVSELWFQNKKVDDVDVTSGIRQGCTGSPWLFVMVMNELIEGLISTGIGFKNEKFRIPVLMFADDGLLMAQTSGEMKVLIKKVNEVANKLGMKVNKSKSVVVAINSTEQIEKIEEIKATNSVKYLGVNISNDKDCFKLHKVKLKDSKRMSNLTYSVIAKSCNKVDIGKTYWKSVALPSILFGSAVVM